MSDILDTVRELQTRIQSDLEMKQVKIKPVKEKKNQEPLNDIISYLRSIRSTINMHTKQVSCSGMNTNDDRRKITVVRVANYPSKFGAKIYGYYSGTSDQPAVPLTDAEVQQYQSGDQGVANLFDALQAEATSNNRRCIKCGKMFNTHDVEYGSTECPECMAPLDPESVAYTKQQKDRSRVVSGEYE